MAKYVVVGPKYTKYYWGEVPDPPETYIPWFEVEAESAGKAKAQLVNEDEFRDNLIDGQNPFSPMAAIRRPDCYEEHEEESGRRIEALGDNYTEEEFNAVQEGICNKCERFLRNIDRAIERLNAKFNNP